MRFEKRYSYVILLVCIVVSAIGFNYVESEQLKELTSTVGSISGAMIFIKMGIEEIGKIKEHSRKKEVLLKQLAVDSKIAYEMHFKYMEFANKYIQEFITIRNDENFGRPSEQHGLYGDQLRKVREEYLLYIPESISLELLSFEKQFYDLGKNMEILNINKDRNYREKHLDELFKPWGELRGLSNSEKLTIDEVIEHIKSTLSITNVNKLLTMTFKEVEKL